MTGGLVDCCSIKGASGAVSCPVFAEAVCVTVVGSGLDSPAPEGLPSASVLREDFFLNQWRNDINSRGTRLALFGRSDGRLKAQTAEFSGYVSESSSFCLFILPPHQDRRQKLELSLT